MVACGGARALTMKRGGDVDRVCRVNKKGIDKELPSSRNVDDSGWVRQVRRHHRCMRPCDDGRPLRTEADAAWQDLAIAVTTTLDYTATATGNHSNDVQRSKSAPAQPHRSHRHTHRVARKYKWSRARTQSSLGWTLEKLDTGIRVSRRGAVKSFKILGFRLSDQN